MCVYDASDIEVLEKNLVAYKVVVPALKAQGKYLSRFDPLSRRVQGRNFIEKQEEWFYYPKVVGVTKNYFFNKKSISRFKDSPGLYCFTSIQTAIKSGILIGWGSTLLRVLIPKGTKIRMARTFEDSPDKETILTEVLIPLEEVKENLEEVAASLDEVDADGTVF